jgi:hypothetical protein
MTATGGGAAPPPPFPGDAKGDRAVFLWAARALAAPFAAALAKGVPLAGAVPAIQAARPRAAAGLRHLEAAARLLNGLAPAVAAEARGEAPLLPGLPLVPLARGLLTRLAEGADRPGWTVHRQALCEAAILAQGMLRAPRALWHDLPDRARAGLEAGLRDALDAHAPPLNNWVLFPPMVEAAFHALGLKADPLRLDLGLRQMDLWYRGDGLYADGPRFRLDGYNSMIIHPMLLDILGAAADLLPDGQALMAEMARRAVQAARQDERMVHPDGSFAPLGRSLTYRAGRFHLIARLALSPVPGAPPKAPPKAAPDAAPGAVPDALPAAVPGLPPGLARALLARVLWRTLTPPGTFDAEGWLAPGLSGLQPGLAEGYVSRGSLYFTATALLPLGLPPTDGFWTDPAPPLTQGALWHPVVDHPP